MREVASHNGDPSGSPFKRSCDQLNRRITGCKITADGNTFQRYGWLFYYSKINDISYLAQLDALVKKYALRFGVNLPPDTPSFKKAYYQMRYKGRQSSYFPVFHLHLSAQEARKVLNRLIDPKIVSSLSDDEVLVRYRREIDRIIRGLEKDIGAVS